MYHATSRFFLVSLDSVWEDAIKAVEPLERFTHEFQTLDTVPSNPPREATAFIVRHSGECAPEEIRKRLAPSTRLILCTDKNKPEWSVIYDISALL